MVKVISEVETPYYGNNGIEKSVILNIDGVKAKIDFDMYNGGESLEVAIFNGTEFNCVLTIGDIISNNKVERDVSYISSYSRQQAKANDYIKQARKKLLLLLK